MQTTTTRTLEFSPDEGVTLLRALTDYRNILKVSRLRETSADIVDAELKSVNRLFDRVLAVTEPRAAR